MGIGSRPATCASCGKRLGRKRWYYRNGNYFCTRRCWVTHQDKAATERAKGAGAKPSGPEAPAVAQRAAPAEAAGEQASAGTSPKSPAST